MKVLVLGVILLYVSQHALGEKVCEGAESVLLPCFLPVTQDSSVVWELSEMLIYGRDPSGGVEQNESYRNRTRMTSDPLKTGNLSLVLDKPTVNDSHNYTCTVREGGVNRNHVLVQLLVGECPGDQTEDKTTITVLVVVVVVVVAVGVVCFYLKQRKKKAGHSSGPRDPEWNTAGPHRDNNTTQREESIRLLEGGVQQVEVDSGAESVLLPCETTKHLPADVRVEWTDGDNKKVHVYQSDSDQPEDQDQDQNHRDQDENYRGRTEMNRDPQRPGDLSLILKHPRDRDTDFTCTVYRDKDVLMKKQVELKFKVHQVEVDSGEEFVLLSFKTSPDLPEDIEVIWWYNEHMRTDPPKVHVYQNGSDRLEDQDRVYRDRTEMKEDLQRTGVLSLILKHPTDRDNGQYTCRVFNGFGQFIRQKRLTLQVTETSGLR